MEWLTPDMAKAGIAVVAGGVSAYAAIRADLARMKERINAAHDAAASAHARLDRHLEGHL